MRFRSRGTGVSAGLALMLLALFVRPAHAQDALFESCQQINVSGRVTAISGYSEIRRLIEPHLRNLCSQVVSTVASVQPIIGVAFSGGNPVLGTGSALGRRFGVPRFSVTGRVNVAVADVPELVNANVGQLVGDRRTIQPLQTSRYPIPSVQVDLAVGVLDGFSLTPAIGGFGALDLLGSVAFVPAVHDIRLEEGILNVGGGVRVGIIDGGAVMPGISISGMYRQLSDMKFGSMQQGDAAQFRTNLSTWSGRAVVSKGLLMVDFAAGAGIDYYSGDVNFAWALECRISECLEVNRNQPIIVSGSTAGDLSTTAWNVFGNVGLSVAMLNVVGEVGYQQVMDPDRLDSFMDMESGGLLADDLGDGHIFTSLGLRLAL